MNGSFPRWILDRVSNQLWIPVLSLWLLGIGCQADEAEPVLIEQVYGDSTYVLGVEPPENAQNVDLHAPIYVVFNRPVSGDLTDLFHFRVLDSTGTPVEGEVTIQQANGLYVALFEPQTILQNGNKVKAALLHGSTYYIQTQFLRDEVGHYIGDYMSQFMTTIQDPSDGTFNLAATSPTTILESPLKGVTLFSNSFGLIFNELLLVDTKEFDENGCSTSAFKDAVQILVSDFSGVIPPPPGQKYKPYKEIPWPGRFCLETIGDASGPNAVFFRASVSFPGLSMIKVIINKSDSLRGLSSGQTMKETRYLLFFNVLPGFDHWFGFPSPS